MKTSEILIGGISLSLLLGGILAKPMGYVFFNHFPFTIHSSVLSPGKRKMKFGL